jgi:MFS-type transporter involved in bile tolerance (Atg22 family)
MPSGVVSITAALIVGFGVRKSENRWAWLAFCCIPGIIGGGLMSFMPAKNRAALLVGIYLVNAITGTLTVIYQWTMANVAGHTKRTIAAALIAGSFSIGNIIGPQTFQAKDAPEYHPAKIAVLATQAGGAVVSIVLFGYYIWANKQKDKRQAVKGGLASSVGDEKVLWENLTDFENPNFRYVY